MIYLAIDTCVWLELLKTDFNREDNYFNEIVFWVDNGHLTLLTTENLVAEWERNKVDKKHTIIKAFKDHEQKFVNLSSGSNPLKDYFNPEKVENSLTTRISVIDRLLTSKAEIAKQGDAIFVEAAKRNLHCIAPNHSQDSFRDTVNILSLKEYILQRGHEHCIFTSINYRDFSEGDPYKIHSQLKEDFIKWKMEYVYFDNKEATFSGKLFNVFLRPQLPSFNEHLKAAKKAEQGKKIADRKTEMEKLSDIPDPNYIEYTLKIDDIISSGGKKTELDEVILDFLFNKHIAYENYFIRKLTEHGMV